MTDQTRADMAAAVRQAAAAEHAAWLDWCRAQDAVRDAVAARDRYDAATRRAAAAGPALCATSAHGYPCTEGPNHDGPHTFYGEPFPADRAQ